MEEMPRCEVAKINNDKSPIATARLTQSVTYRSDQSGLRDGSERVEDLRKARVERPKLGRMVFKVFLPAPEGYMGKPTPDFAKIVVARRKMALFGLHSRWEGRAALIIVYRRLSSSICGSTQAAPPSATLPNLTIRSLSLSIGSERRH